MVIDLARKLNLNKPIKCFDSDDWKEYNHKRYEKEKEKRLKYQKEYYEKNKIKIKINTRKRYRIKCGLEE